MDTLISRPSREKSLNGIKKTYKYRLYPNKNQRALLEENLSLCRWLYNHLLEERRFLYDKNKTMITCYNQIKEIPRLKKEKPELTKVYSQILQDVARRLDKAFQNFFRRVEENKKGKTQKLGYPRFKGYWRYDSLIYPQSGFVLKKGSTAKNSKLCLSKIGSLKVKLHREIEENIKTLTIRRTRTNKWYACFLVEIQRKLPQPKEIKNIIGIDMGIHSFLTTDQGEKVDSQRYFIRLEEKLAKIQKHHSRKKLKSFNRKKAQFKIAKIYEKITNQRQDFLHKLSHKIVKNFQLIAFEKLNIKGMVRRNKYLAKSISDASWSRFLQMLKYKAAEAGIWAIGINARNTSQACSDCGNIVTKTLDSKKHECHRCQLILDRDINAARNILNLALTTVGTTGSNACGVERLFSTMKQEAAGFNFGGSSQ